MLIRDSNKKLSSAILTGVKTPGYGKKKTGVDVQKNLISNMEHIINWFEPGVERGRDIYISGFPFFHLAGFPVQKIQNKNQNF